MSTATTQGLEAVGPGPLTFTSEMQVHPDHVEQFTAALLACSRQAAGEQGNVFLYATQSAENPTVFLMFEQWESAAAFQEQELDRPYFQAYIAATANMHVRERIGRLWTLLPLER